MRRALIVSAVLTLLAGCAPTEAQRQQMAENDARTQTRLQARLAGYTAGQPQTCIEPNLTQNSERFGTTILYSNTGNLIYRNDTMGGCDFDRDALIVTKSYSGQLCRGDIVHLVDRNSHMFSGSCTFGSFIPYRK